MLVFQSPLIITGFFYAHLWYFLICAINMTSDIDSINCFKYKFDLSDVVSNFSNNRTLTVLQLGLFFYLGIN